MLLLQLLVEIASKLGSSDSLSIGRKAISVFLPMQPFRVFFPSRQEGKSIFHRTDRQAISQPTTSVRPLSCTHCLFLFSLSALPIVSCTLHCSTYGRDTMCIQKCRSFSRNGHFGDRQRERLSSVSVKDNSSLWGVKAQELG